MNKYILPLDILSISNLKIKVNAFFKNFSYKILLYSSIRGQPFHTYIEKGDSMRTENRFSKTIENTGHRIKGILNALPQTIKNNTEEFMPKNCTFVTNENREEILNYHFFS